ncbi:MAG: aminoacyl-tRNA hydrolase, partial [Sulfurimonadaceae bacterium]|nr:aminoacyl-tRNA hydrolase [Sulfurimonadaceae bacterium]
YLRVRMGIGKPEYKSQVADYVLSPFSEAEQAHLETWIKRTADAVEKLLEESWENVASRCSVKAIDLAGSE